MEKIIEPRIGMRFTMHGAKFEVSFTSGGAVRYSSSAGGPVHSIPYADFLELQIQGTLVPSESSEIAVTVHNGPVIVRKHRYVEAAIRTLTHPTAKIPLAQVIKTVAAEISDAKPPSIRSVSYWILAFRQHKTAGFAPRKRIGNRTIRFGVEVEQLITQAIDHQYLKPERRRGDAVFSQVIGRAAELGYCSASHDKIRLPSARTIQRRLKRLDPYLVVRAQQGALAASKVARAAGKSVKAGAILAIVQMDTHMLDIHVVDPDTGELRGRPYLTCVLDMNSRCIVGTYVSLYCPSATTSLAALKDMLVRYGVPTLVIPDNGVEFANSAFILLCSALAITILPAQNRDPNGKAHIESFFRTLTTGLIQLLEGTTFSSPTARGDYGSTKKARFTLEQVQSFADEWINEFYHKKVHTGTLRAPILAWEDQAKVSPPLKLSAPDVDVLARRPYQRTIHGGRVQYDNLHYHSDALRALEARGQSRVTVLIDELNLHTVFVEDPNEKGNFIEAESIDPAYTDGLTQYAHTEAMAIKNKMSEADRNRFGQNANMIARWQLLKRIQVESEAAAKWLRKLTNGAGRNRLVKDQLATIESRIDANQDEPVVHRLPVAVVKAQTNTSESGQGTWQAIPKLDSFDVG